MSRVPRAPLYLGCARSARPLPRGFTGHVAHPIRSIVLGCARSARPLPRGFTGHVAHPIRSILLPSSFLLLTFPAAIGSFTFEVIGGSLRAPSSRRRSKSSEIFA